MTRGVRKHLGIRGGRGLAVAVWALVLVTSIMGLTFLALWNDKLDSSVLGGSLIAYFSTVGVISGAYLTKNIAEGFRSGAPQGAGRPPEDK